MAILFSWWLAALLGSSCGGPDFDRRVAAPPGGDLSVDVELGSGISFDHGSLEIRSPPADDVRVVADVSGWGGYAVDIEVHERAGGVQVVGRVEGLLHWAFGGPTVDVRVFVPRGYRVDARIDGGPLVLEDLVGPLDARVEGSEIVLRRIAGDVHIAASGGDVSVEDVEGTLAIESRDRGVEVSDVRGDVVVRTGRGSIRIRSLEGRVDAATRRGDIGVEDLEGSVVARSERGDVEIDFDGDPAGQVETGRGSIRVAIPLEAAFTLDAQTARGDVELDDDFDVAPDVAAAPPPGPAVAEWVELGEEMAREVREKVLPRVRDNVDRGLREGNWHELDWDFDWSWDAWDEHRQESDPGRRERGAGWHRVRSRRGERVAGAVHGGGETLLLRTGRGEIEIDER